MNREVLQRRREEVGRMEILEAEQMLAAVRDPIQPYRKARYLFEDGVVGLRGPWKDRRGVDFTCDEWGLWS